MQVIFSPKHRQHAPPAEFVSSGLGPYSESPTRADSILAALESSGRFDVSQPTAHADAALEAVHDAAYLDFLQQVYAVWSTPTAPGGNGIIPLTFAVRGLDTCPADLVGRAGYYCFDAQTPIVRGTFAAARAAVDAALTGADRLLAGDAAAYALCRPPGHHAAAAMYGGYCYLNNAAVAAAYLLERGRSPVAVLDIDYHHGNGTQEIFYHTDQVLTLSIHADPNRAYPHYLGYAGETGKNSGKGANFNLPLPPHVGDEDYLSILADALVEIRAFSPAALVLSLGVDTCIDDPLGDFDLSLDAFSDIGRAVASLNLPTLAVQEGGYAIAEVGRAVLNVLTALQ
ncbi:MAG: acetylpolyamine amidohydrolase [Gemmatimonadetes bacterium]|nr:acetylpolyamine amidohydrolase [Gemmatimonadota bacterium]